MKKILLSSPFLAGEELVCRILDNLTGRASSDAIADTELTGNNEEELLSACQYSVVQGMPSDVVAGEVCLEEVYPVFLVRNLYDLLLDQYRYHATAGNPEWQRYFGGISQSDGISVLISGARYAGLSVPGLDFWCRQMQEMLLYAEQNVCFVMSYERLLQNPGMQLRKLAEFIGVELSEGQHKELENDLIQEINRRTGMSEGNGGAFNYGRSCEHLEKLAYYHVNMIQNILTEHLPDLGDLSARSGFNEITALPANIFVSTVFKSGTKLIEYLVARITGLAIKEFEQEAGSDYENADLIEFENGKFFIWHSFPTDEVKEKLRATRAKPVFLIRNIYDLLVSQYFHFADDVDEAIGRSTKTAEYFSEMSLEEGLSLVLCGATSERFHWHGFGYSLRQIQEMLLFSRQYPCHVVTYDNLVNNKRAEIERLSRFLGVQPDPGLLDELLENSSLGSMRDARTAAFGSGKHFRKGQPGDHVNVLKPSHYHMMNHIKLVYAPLLDELCVELGFGDVVSPENAKICIA